MKILDLKNLNIVWKALFLIKHMLIRRSLETGGLSPAPKKKKKKKKKRKETQINC